MTMGKVLLKKKKKKKKKKQKKKRTFRLSFSDVVDRAVVPRGATTGPWWAPRLSLSLRMAARSFRSS